MSSVLFTHSNKFNIPVYQIILRKGDTHSARNVWLAAEWRGIRACDSQNVCASRCARATIFVTEPPRLPIEERKGKASGHIDSTHNRPTDDATSDRRVQSVQSGVAFPTDGISQFSRWRAALARAVTFCRNYNNSPHTLEIRIESKPYNFTYHSQFSASEV